MDLAHGNVSAPNHTATAIPVTPWPASCTPLEKWIIILSPIAMFFLIVVVLNLWKVPEKTKKPKFRLPAEGGGYGAINQEDGVEGGRTERADTSSSTSSDTLHPGQIAGAYTEDWRKTFDFVFLMFMTGFLVLLVVVTLAFRPILFHHPAYWLYQLPKMAAMMGVSLLGGIVCRMFCVVDDQGYVLTTKSSSFKVNYTRKLQHFAAYMVPLVVKPKLPGGITEGPLELAWGDFFTLLCFLVLIKPVRERFRFFMLQFNSLDRPEDRPNTMKWIIAGNILPGLALIIIFRALFASFGQQSLVFIIICITGIGDGLAEPIGIAFGKHKYKTGSWFSTRKYTRSYEGSACVFLSGMVFPAMLYQSFHSGTQVAAAMIILPPVMAYSEATAPHTMDTPVLMTMGGLILYAIIRFL